jgi:YegS/Rv2252/BmrU family lipid kinase
MKKGILFYNPKSGGQSILNKLDFILNKFQRNNMILQPYRLDINSNRNIIALVKEETFDFAVISGGDGTLNSIVNILLKNVPNLPLGIIPAGTCNDFARCLNLPNSLEKALNVIIRGKLSLVDVGLIDNSKYFLSSCSGGMFVDVSFNTEHELKKNFGPLAYYLKALSKAVNIKSFSLNIKTETQEFTEEVILFLVLNGKHAAGFSNIDDEADFTDGIMNVLLIKNCSRMDLANLFFKVLGHKPFLDQYVTKIKAKKCSFTCTQNIDISIDGEQCDKIPTNIDFINKRLHVFIP